MIRLFLLLVTCLVSRGECGVDECSLLVLLHPTKTGGTTVSQFLARQCSSVQASEWHDDDVPLRPELFPYSSYYCPADGRRWLSVESWLDGGSFHQAHPRLLVFFNNMVDGGPGKETGDRWGALAGLLQSHLVPGEAFTVKVGGGGQHCRAIVGATVRSPFERQISQLSFFTEMAEHYADRGLDGLVVDQANASDVSVEASFGVPHEYLLAFLLSPANAHLARAHQAAVQAAQQLHAVLQKPDVTLDAQESVVQGLLARLDADDKQQADGVFLDHPLTLPLLTERIDEALVLLSVLARLEIVLVADYPFASRRMAAASVAPTSQQMPLWAVVNDNSHAQHPSRDNPKLLRPDSLTHAAVLRRLFRAYSDPLSSAYYNRCHAYLSRHLAAVSGKHQERLDTLLLLLWHARNESGQWTRLNSTYPRLPGVLTEGDDCLDG